MKETTTKGKRCPRAKSTLSTLSRSNKMKEGRLWKSDHPTFRIIRVLMTHSIKDPQARKEFIIKMHLEQKICLVKEETISLRARYFDILFLLNFFKSIAFSQNRFSVKYRGLKKKGSKRKN